MAVFEILPSAPPSYEAAVPLALARAQCRVIDEGYEDELIGFFRDAACELVEKATSKLLVRRTVGWRGSWLYGQPASIGIGPIARVVSGSYIDSLGASVALATSGSPASVTGVRLLARDRIGPLTAAAWPGTNRSNEAGTVELQIEAGYAAGQVPMALRQAALMMIGHFFAHREAVMTGAASGEMPFGFAELTSPFRNPGIG